MVCNLSFAEYRTLFHLHLTFQSHFRYIFEAHTFFTFRISYWLVMYFSWLNFLNFCQSCTLTSAEAGRGRIIGAKKHFVIFRLNSSHGAISGAAEVRQNFPLSRERSAGILRANLKRLLLGLWLLENLSPSRRKQTSGFTRLAASCCRLSFLIPPNPFPARALG